MDMNNRYAKTGLTKEDLLALLSEAGIHLTEAYALMGRDEHQDTARRVLDAWEFMLTDYLGEIDVKPVDAHRGNKKVLAVAGA